MAVWRPLGFSFLMSFKSLQLVSIESLLCQSGLVWNRSCGRRRLPCGRTWLMGCFLPMIRGQRTLFRWDIWLQFQLFQGLKPVTSCSIINLYSNESRTISVENLFGGYVLNSLNYSKVDGMFLRLKNFSRYKSIRKMFCVWTVVVSICITPNYSWVVRR